MKIEFVIFETKIPEWVRDGRDEFVKKIRPFCPFEIRTLKAPAKDRAQAGEKRKKEGELLLKNLQPNDLLVLFDEGGRTFKNSEAFSAHFKRGLETGKPRLVLCIGGAYGFDEAVKRRSAEQWSLSGLTYNHLVAQLVALEQIYRAFTLIKGLPYHNR